MLMMTVDGDTRKPISAQSSHPSRKKAKSYKLQLATALTSTWHTTTWNSQRPKPPSTATGQEHLKMLHSA